MDSYGRVRKQNMGFVGTVNITGAAVAATHLQTIRSANHTFFIQKVTVAISTHVAGKVFSLQDDASTPIVVAGFADLAAAAGVPDVRTWDFGADGVALTAGKNLDWLANTSGSGFVGVLKYEGYQKLTATINTGTANTAN